MIHVQDIGLDPHLLNNHIEDGLIRVQTHPTLPLRILNYTEQAQFNKRWNDYTMACRGLIVDEFGFIIARPWKKFFNLGEGYAEFDWDAPVEVTDKMDGSLGILYFGQYEWAIATRGSFDSEQARHATKVWESRYSHLSPSHDYTFLFEIIYPANRIVLNYDGLDDLVLLGAVDKKYGYYLGPQAAAGLLGWTGPVTKTFSYTTLQEAFSADPRPNAEGYVVRSGNKMVKIKQVDYVELHRIVTNLNERTIWEHLAAGKTVESLCESIPDEWHEWVRKVADGLERQHEDRMDDVVGEFLSIKAEIGDADRKTYAQRIVKEKDAGLLFKLLDGKRIDDVVWRELKPSVSKE